jgi:hypothetical protein
VSHVAALYTRAACIEPADYLASPVGSGTADPYAMRPLQLIHVQMRVERDWLNARWRGACGVLPTSPTVTAACLQTEIRSRIAAAVSDAVALHRRGLAKIQVQQQRDLRSLRERIVSRAGVGADPLAVIDFSRSHGTALGRRAMDLIPTTAAAAGMKTTANPADVASDAASFYSRARRGPATVTAGEPTTQPPGGELTAAGSGAFRQLQDALGGRAGAADGGRLAAELGERDSDIEAFESRCWWLQPIDSGVGDDDMSGDGGGGGDWGKHPPCCWLDVLPVMVTRRCPDHATALVTRSCSDADQAVGSEPFWLRAFTGSELSRADSAHAGRRTHQSACCSQPTCGYAVSDGLLLPRHKSAHRTPSRCIKQRFRARSWLFAAFSHLRSDRRW